MFITIKDTVINTDHIISVNEYINDNTKKIELQIMTTHSRIIISGLEEYEVFTFYRTLCGINELPINIAISRQKRFDDMSVNEHEDLVDNIYGELLFDVGAYSSIVDYEKYL